MLSRTARIHVAGHRGLVGSAVWRHLERSGFPNVIGRSSAELDLRDRAAVDTFYEEVRPEYVVLAAARGRAASSPTAPDRRSSCPTTCASRSTCSTRRPASACARCSSSARAASTRGSPPQPISEDALLTGPLEPTNDAYAIAKIAGILHVQALRRQYGLPYISAMPTNLYGPGDNFDLETSHVLPAMIRKFHDAKVSGALVT